MLAFNPNQRYSLSEIIAADAWFNNENQMGFAEYFSTMEFIHSKISY